MMPYSEINKEARLRYEKKKLKRVPLDLQQTFYENVLKPVCDELGEPVNTFIKNAIKEKINSTTSTDISPDTYFVDVSYSAKSGLWAGESAEMDISVKTSSFEDLMTLLSPKIEAFLKSDAAKKDKVTVRMLSFNISTFSK